MLATFLQTNRIEAGCDEAGRGCLAGPVFAAAVILPTDIYLQELHDSKQVHEQLRFTLRAQIQAQALAYAVAQVDHQEIDKINILKASHKAMHLALDKLHIKPHHILVDGNRFSAYTIPHTCIIKGDGKFASIAAASILAKTYRDEFMLDLHKQYPIYGWDKNKGYPTKSHRDAIEKYGLSPYHRKSFSPCATQLRLI